MSLIKIKGKGQMTLPVDIREQLSISEGDLLEARIEKGNIVLTPKTIVDRQAAFARLEEIGKRAEERWRREGLTDDDIEKMIAETVEEVRADLYAKGEQHG